MHQSSILWTVYFSNTIDYRKQEYEHTDGAVVTNSTEGFDADPGKNDFTPIITAIAALPWLATINDSHSNQCHHLPSIAYYQLLSFQVWRVG